MSTAVIERPPPNGQLCLPRGPTSVAATMEALKTVRTFVANELVDGIDFGPIPGTDQKKKNMLLPGALKVNMFFGCYPRFVMKTTELGSGHVEHVITTELISRADGEVIGMGVGSCSTMESKYRYRNDKRRCPACGEPSIIKTIKGRNPGGYWCVPDKGGCGANFNPGDQSVEGQKVGKVENPDVYDVRNTVLKMAKKRSVVDASIGLACLADMFTQDIEDVYDMPDAERAEEPSPAAKPAPQATKPKPPAEKPKDPTTPAELRPWLDAIYTAIHDEGLIEKWEDAHDFVRSKLNRGREKPLGKDPAKWPADVVKTAVLAAREFYAMMRAQKAKPDKPADPDDRPLDAAGLEQLDQLLDEMGEQWVDVCIEFGLPKGTPKEKLTVGQLRKLLEKAKEPRPGEAAE